jgi:hypothetical protein
MREEVPPPHRAVPVRTAARHGAPQRRPSVRTIVLVTAAALAVGGVAVAMPVALGAPGAAGPVVIPAAADTYVIRQFPGAVKGGADKLTAARWTNWQTEAYLSSWSRPP